MGGIDESDLSKKGGRDEGGSGSEGFCSRRASLQPSQSSEEKDDDDGDDVLLVVIKIVATPT